MREILFRGQTRKLSEKVKMQTGEKLPEKWVYGGIFQCTGCYSVMYGCPDANDITGATLELHVVYTDTVGQFTGLTDKNGTKIFEGDILKQKTTTKFAEVSLFEWERYGVVRFGYHDWGDKNEAGYASEGWYIEPLRSVSVNPKNYGVGYIQSGLNQCDILDEYYPMEVIGNIHDNPELIGG